MNKNGFTLVELIAVIVILGLLALIANSSVVNVVKNSKSDLYNTQLKLIESAAESWGNDNLDKLPNDGECKYLTLANLKNYGLMEEEIINPKTNKEFSDNLYIKITSKINSSGMLKTTYKVDDSVNGCTEALPPVCTLALDSEKTGLENGAKYNCKVKETMEVEYPNGYTFYVLGKNEDGTISLIMDRNFDSAVAWGNEGDLTPTIALDYLNSMTSDWIVNIGLPTYNQIYKSKGNIDLNQLTWLIGGFEGTLFNGYWTSSVSSTNTNNAIYLSNTGELLEDAFSNNINYGVRPVITLYDYQIR